MLTLIVFMLYSCCLVTVGGLLLFLRVPWVCLQNVTVVYPDHTHFNVAECMV